MKIFVTGGAGYVGSHCVRRLVQAGHAVTVFDSLEFGHRAAIAPGAAFVQGDLRDAGRLAAVLTDQFDAVMHFAAYLNVGESVKDPLLYYRNNVANTIHLLETMKNAGIRRMVFSSTCAVYGEPERLPIVEDLPKNPINPYGRTKLAVEFMLQDCATAWGLGSVALRYFNASGAAPDGSIGEDHSPETHLIPLVLQVALGQRESIDVLGTDYPTPDGTCVRDYIHVDDLAEAHLKAVEGLREGQAEAYNVGTGNGASVREVIETAALVTGKKITTREAARRPGDPPQLWASADRLKERFGWTPAYTELKPIIETAWRWHHHHPTGYNDR